MHRLSRFHLQLASLCAAVLLLASPLAAYTIYLKSGATIVARNKYQVQKNRAIITLMNGTQTALDASQIDVARTEAANRGTNYGSATVVDSGASQAAAEPAPPAEERLADAVRKAPQVQDRPQVRRARQPEDAGKPLPTLSGFADLSSLPSRPFAALDVTAELRQFLAAQGIEDAVVNAGTANDRPLVQLSPGSEGSVFQDLAVCANALLRLRDRFPQKVAALEIVMTTPGHERAGQFVLTPGLAADLVAKRIDPATFFVNNVQF